MKITLYEAIIDAMRTLGGERHYTEIDDWILSNYGPRWKSCQTEVADMVHPERGGKNNISSRLPIEKRVLTREGDGIYSL
ncbi:hypothetical protein FHS15_005775 [Paenibacillus castaneae]|uniref:hypothetical protein n=1 Tax=Paenibacillus castaneae TaxID=474957 RepID=UPI000C998B46|nr:hypothetical protein [Paenibacillus castaneae]NIK80584.1 hypothetical protein [Paenibacillus castaneae]